MQTRNKLSILFVCTANRFRSPIAEAEFRKLLLEHGETESWIVESAGSWTTDGLPPIPSASWMLDHTGLDLSNHQSKSVSRELIAQFDLILVMEKGQKEALRTEYPEMSRKILMLTELTGDQAYDIPDPVRQPDESSENIALEIINLLERNINEICLRVTGIKEEQGNN